MKDECDVPEMLKETQEWFASIITRPIDPQSHMNPISPSGVPMVEESKKYILPSPTLEPHQRIEIYNQQYWWRLLTVLHENLPLIVRLFGYFDFNQRIGFPYLCEYRPDTWSLNPLGTHVVQWMEDHYHEEDRQLVIDAAKVDVAYNDGFVVEGLPPLSTEEIPDMSEVIDMPLKLQPSVALFQMNYHLFPFRAKMLDQEPEYWEENEFPELVHGENILTILYRNRAHNMCWEEIDLAEHHLLTLFKQGTTIAKACESLERQSAQIVNQAEKNLASWLQKWVVRGLLWRNSL